MRSFKRLSILILAFALSAIGAANASAATFTASATGSLSGKATSTQVLTVNGGQVKCTNAAMSGTITSTASTEQHVTVNYSGCTAFGFANVHISPATYNLTANGTVHVKNTVTINVTVGGCTITVGPQTVGKVNTANNGSKRHTTIVIVVIVYSSSGGLCGSSGANGTMTGSNEAERVGGGTLSFDP